ncbi:DNA primase [Clostridium pasteurianum DSM 525 = ATCC 6013]|uniref:DNA primase n=1 Tax=Clostridium pasteurianum DSM 525 = ATCC 6013 TaxID=1262449 RepID=A0A0H3JA93_CLOPA|nr:DNA primase [Clostridium pasteurianum]AJA48360.1 DNA primase [Clostridium pasteurianum DSM 525 = ATCC 6013]AJA52348.1 DNA primase [Clostridium pasteurianum DSM 525 = ATCC 6013]AOZ75606.1 DNA primase [Clostridium pasteurianum DSM 525 = ATCC 6013]AOZ79402.1 DNA primase [Clostridium pasteurianum]ELP60490.1 DNA primase [Clostridium pasteurianum DSM 525 = ATCC 6013]
MIPEDVIEKIKYENDIVDVISDTVKLKKSGRNYMGLCPFHNEKSPSFSVSEDKQIYKCFGCGEAGNVITFVMKTKSLSFIDAVKLLAERIHLDLDYLEKGNNKKKDTNDKLLKLNVDAARFFFSNLNSNKKAKNYFINRGILESTIRSFGLGYALDDWHGIMNFLKRKGYSDLDLLNAGLIIKNEKGNKYDRFRNRVMFPVFDYKGKVIGFGGRVLDDSKPKYLNSPETALFKKGINLYGLNFVLKNDNKRTIIIVEGYMDCITLHQYGINNTVASLGTALTVNQAKLLKRYADNIIISYDADTAGQKATLRGLKILRDVGLNVKVLIVPKGKDPDEFIRNNGKEAFEELIKNSMNLIDYRIKKAGENVNFRNNREIPAYIKKIADILIDLDPIEKDVYIKRVSEETGIKEQAIYDLLSEERHKSTNYLQNMNNIGDYGQKLYLEPAYIKAERLLLKLMNSNEEAYNYIVKKLDPDNLNLESHKKIFNLIAENKLLDLESRNKIIEIKCDDAKSSSEWINICEEKFANNDCNIEELIDDYIFNIKKFKLEESKKEIMKKIKYYETNGMIEKSLKMVKELNHIQEEINSLL